MVDLHMLLVRNFMEHNKSNGKSRCLKRSSMLRMAYKMTKICWHFNRLCNPNTRKVDGHRPAYCES